MKLVLQREKSTAHSTPGQLFVDGTFQCYTLEDVIREQRFPDGTLIPVAAWKVDKQTSIPSGTYRVIIDFSNRFQRFTPKLLDVPGFTAIRIHSGNTDADTEGCILVGRTREVDSVLQSRPAFGALFTRLQDALTKGEIVEIEIINPVETDVELA